MIVRGNCRCHQVENKSPDVSELFEDFSFNVIVCPFDDLWNKVRPVEKKISIIDNQNYMLKTFMKEIRYYLPYPKKDVE